MWQLGWSGLVIVLACVAGSGCSSGGTDDEAGLGGDGPEGGGRPSGDHGDGGAGGGDAAEEAAQTKACARYVECIAAVEPAMLSDVDASVGEDGACWAGSASKREACDHGCAEGLAAMRDVAPGEARCDECVDDADCEGARPVCVAQDGSYGDVEHVCGGCRDDSDCPHGERCEGGTCAAPAPRECNMEQSFAAFGLTGECERACTRSIDEACTSSELCCMLDAFPQCGDDAACITETCGPSNGCVGRLENLHPCVEACAASYVE